MIDSKGDAKCILQNTNVSIVSFNDVTSDHAQKEGEGEKTLDYWKKAHLKFWGDVSPNEKIVCEEFKVVFISVC